MFWIALCSFYTMVHINACEFMNYVSAQLWNLVVHWKPLCSRFLFLVETIWAAALTWKQKFRNVVSKLSDTHKTHGKSVRLLATRQTREQDRKNILLTMRRVRCYVWRVGYQRTTYGVTGWFFCGYYRNVSWSNVNVCANNQHVTAAAELAITTIVNKLPIA